MTTSRHAARAALLLALLILPTPARALTADELVLVVNAKVPEGVKLAEFYAAQRKVPAGRIVALDLPFPQEEMSPAIYDAQVVPKLRAFLKAGGLEAKVTCLVTFYGVPLRIQNRQPTPQQNAEMADRDRELRRVMDETSTAVTDLEAVARDADPAFQPAAGQTLEELAARAEAAGNQVRAAMPKIDDVARRDRAYTRLIAVVRLLAGRGVAIREASRPELLVHHPQPVTREEAAQVEREYKAAQAELAQTQQKLTERAARDRVLAIVRDHFGSLQYAQALRSMRQALDAGESTAAFDSELSLLWVDNYAKPRWVPNLLYHRVAVQGTAPRTLMVTRIDGPTEPVARRVVVDSIKTEQQGLGGAVVLDARGNHGNDGYAQYDKTIRSLADLLKAKTKLDVRLDDTPELFPPGSQKDVALYCGWYSLRTYVPSSAFKTGAVGFHIASSELVSLRAPDEKGWVANLLNDGVVGTLGPVAEPYLHSFPAADEFFPLLLTGKLTLAEVYWKSNPLTSWMNTCVGDPLYRPFAKNPAMKVEDLPEPLKKALATPSGGAGPAPAAK